MKHICKYCTKEMKARREDEEYIYECDCHLYLQMQYLLRELNRLERKRALVQQSIHEIEKKSALHQEIIAINQKYGIGLDYKLGR